MVDLKLSDATFRVFVDADNGLDLKRCTRISRFLESHIESLENIPDNYVLEVSSPGLDMPLQLKRQYQKNVGRELKVQFGGEEPKLVEGKLMNVGEDSIELRVKGPKKGMFKNIEIAFSDIDKSFVLVSFKPLK